MAIDFNIARLPYNVEAEQAVLGALIIDPEKMNEIAGYLAPKDFYIEQNGELYEIMLGMYTNAKSIDAVTLIEEMTHSEAFDDGEAKTLVLQLAQFVPTSANIKKYAQIVWEKSILRSLISASSDIAQMCAEGVEDFNTIIDAAEQKIYDISNGKNNNEFTPIVKIVSSVYTRMSELAEGKNDDLKAIPTGLVDLDEKIGGLSKSDLLIIAARPGVGKTSLALNIAQYVAELENKKHEKTNGVAIFSLEMSKEQLVTRLLSSESRVSSKRISRGEIQADEWARLAEGGDSISKCKFYIDDNPMITIAEMKAKIRRQKDIKLVIIDYLQLMNSGTHNENRVQEISTITRNLKIMAKEMNLPIITLSQLSRPPKGAEIKMPQLSDLRESGSIEQDADIVIMLYRDTVAEEFSEEYNTAKCRIAKNRHGETGDIEFTWNGELTRFYNKERTRDGE